jgi:photosystem II stability/assembly factor-like uncharacterized protein
VKTYLFVATAQGILSFAQTGETWNQAGGGLDRQYITSIAAHGNELLAGTREGIYRSADLGQTWWEANAGLTVRHVRWLAYHPDEPGLAFAGTEPANIFVSEDGGKTWQERPEVPRLRDDLGWDLPYSPAAGCVRGFAFHGLRGYAAVEQGGLLRSDDRGQTWRLAQGSSGRPHTAVRHSYLHADVHSVVVHPSSPDQLLAPTGGGFYYSTDGGRSWERLYDAYCRAVWADPVRPGHLILGPADSVDVRGRIEESIDGGQTWQAMEPAPSERWPHHMVERFLQVDNELLAVLSNGGLLSTSLNTLAWRTLLSPVQHVKAVAAAQV